MLISPLVIAENDRERGRDACTRGVKFALAIGCCAPGAGDVGIGIDAGPKPWST